MKAMEMGQLDQAADTVIEAINICEEHLEALVQRESHLFTSSDLVR